MSEQNLNQEEQSVEERTFMQAMFTGKGKVWRIVIVSLALMYITYGILLGILD